MKIRYTLDHDLDAELIQKIVNRAGKKSVSAAAKLMMQEWHYRSKVLDTTCNGQKMVTEASNAGQSDDDNAIDFSGLDTALENI